MLPHFPKAYKAMRDWYNEEMFEGMYSVSPILSQIAIRSQREGSQGSFQQESGQIRAIDYQRRSVEITHQTQEAIGMTTQEFVEAARHPGIEMGKLMMRDLFEGVREATQEVGNVIDAGGAPLTYELLLSMWEKMHIEFDAHGKPRLPSLVVNPKTYASLQEKIPIWLEDAELRRKFENVMERKWAEFCEREARRRLVD